MAAVYNRVTGEFRESANTPDFDPKDWIIFDRARGRDDLDLLSAKGVPRNHWKVDKGEVVEMDAAEKDAVQVADEADRLAAVKASVAATVDAGKLAPVIAPVTATADDRIRALEKTVFGL